VPARILFLRRLWYSLRSSHRSKKRMHGRAKRCRQPSPETYTQLPHTHSRTCTRKCSHEHPPSTRALALAGARTSAHQARTHAHSRVPYEHPPSTRALALASAARAPTKHSRTSARGCSHEHPPNARVLASASARTSKRFSRTCTHKCSHIGAPSTRALALASAGTSTHLALAHLYSQVLAR